MAGNPFRKSVAPTEQMPDEPQYNESPWAEDDFDNDEPPEPPKRRNGKKKKVTIQTPPRSPVESPIHHHPPPRRLSDARADSPPPIDFFSEARRESLELKAKSAADEDLEQAVMNTRRNSGSMPPPSSFAAGGGNQAPYNPFARTLATTEASFGLDKSAEKDEGNDTGDSKPARKPMDMDAFKNMLMTGSAVSSPPPDAAPAKPAPEPQDNGAKSIATSQADQPSYFNDQTNLKEPHSMNYSSHRPSNSFSWSPHSPSSPTSSRSSSDEESGSEEDASLMGPVASRPQELAPPAPPKPKHGRTFPQTVSFADFDDSFQGSPMESGFSAATPQTEQKSGDTLRPGMGSRNASDLNKPLPAPPSRPKSSSDASSTVDDPVQVQEKKPSPPPSGTQTPVPAPVANEEVAAAPPIPAQSKKAPPPPPAARRQGTTPVRPRSGSGGSIFKSKENDLAPLTAATPSAESATKSAAAPPPPPSRRTQVATSTPSGTGEGTPVGVSGSPSPQPAQLAVSPEEKLDAVKSPNVPPPPPRRTISRSSIPTNRTPSTASRNSIIREPASNPPAGAAPGPPPPPPRRGAGGKRDSTMFSAPPSASVPSRRRRPSTNSVDSDGASFVSLAPEEGQGTPTHKAETLREEPAEMASTDTAAQRDILADMSAFQAEIDALRAQEK